MKELKASEKVTQKMTRDGAVVENHVTGEITSITSRYADVDFSAHEDSASTVETVADRVSVERHRHKAKRAAKADAKTLEKGSAVQRRSTSRLQFNDEERADPTLKKYVRRSDRAADKLDKAKEAIPTKKVLKTERTFDKTTGKGKTRLHFVETEKVPNSKLRHNPLSRPMQEVRMAAHRKVREVEQDNVGVEAGHKGEELAERGISKVSGQVRSGIRQHRMKPWRDAVKAEKAAIKANAEFLYQKALHDDPALAASNSVSRYLQKKRIQRSYAMQLRKRGKAGATAVQRAKEAIRKVSAFVGKHHKSVLILLGAGAVAFMLASGASSFSTILSSSAGSILSTSYLSEDEDMLAAEAAYAELESQLQNELDNYETLHPGYDAYQYELDEIKHDPYVLISILSALHEGVFTIDEVQDDLQMLFEKQYILTETVTTETRYRTETQTGTRTVTDPETGQESQEEYEYEVQVPYTYTTCVVSLENFNLSHVPIYIMSEEQLSLYAGYMSTLGNREDLFAGNANASTLRSPTYYDIPPEALEDEQFAAMMAEATKYIGYPYVWGGSSPSTSFDCSGYVSWVLNHSCWNVGRLDANGLYNICTPVSASQAQPGDLVFFVGTYDTVGCSHVGIYVGNNMMLHCGDPISYADLSSSYWQAHLYCFGRLP